MKQTAIQQAIVMVRKRIESMNETLMGKHTAHHLQQVERDLWNLLKEEKEQIIFAYGDGQQNGREFQEAFYNGEDCNVITSEQYYNETYK